MQVLPLSWSESLLDIPFHLLRKSFCWSPEEVHRGRREVVLLQGGTVKSFSLGTYTKKLNDLTLISVWWVRHALLMFDLSAAVLKDTSGVFRLTIPGTFESERDAAIGTCPQWRYRPSAMRQYVGYCNTALHHEATPASVTRLIWLVSKGSRKDASGGRGYAVISNRAFKDRREVGAALLYISQPQDSSPESPITPPALERMSVPSFS